MFGTGSRQMKLSPTAPLRALKGLRVRLTDSPRRLLRKVR